MTTIRQLITDAMREAGILGAGDSPNADIFDENLRRINNIFSSLFGSELGEPLEAINYGKQGITNSYGLAEDESTTVNDAYVPANVRLVCNLEATKTLYLDPNPEDGARFGVLDNSGNFATKPLILDANGRKIELANTVTLSTNSVNREWFFRADLGNWVRVADLVADDPSPLPKEFDDFLITLLAFRIHPRYGAKTSDETVEVLKRMRRIFRARYKQTKEQISELGLYRLLSNKRYWQWSNFNA